MYLIKQGDRENSVVISAMVITMISILPTQDCYPQSIKYFVTKRTLGLGNGGEL